MLKKGKKDSITDISGNIKKKKIMYIVQSIGGVENYLYMLLKYIDKVSYEHILVCTNEYDFKKFKPLVDYIEVVDMVRNLSITKDLGAIKSVRKLIKKYKPDIVYCHSSKGGAIGRIADIGIENKVLYNPHGWSFNMKCSNRKRNMYIMAERMLAHKTNKIIAISKAEKYSAIENNICKSDKIQVIYNGIDIKQYKIDKKSFKITRHGLNIPEDAYIIGMVGRICKQKAPDIFIKSAKLIKEKINNAYFIIIGDGDERKEIEKLIKDEGLLDSVIITGWVVNPMEYLSIVDQVMLLSRWEGFGLAIAEYMLACKPIIATNVDAIPELIQDRYNGYLIDVDDYKSASRKSIEIKEHPYIRNEFIKNGYEIVCEKFNIDRVIEQHHELLKTVINN